MQGLLWYLVDGRLQLAVVLLQDSFHLPENHLVLILAKWYDAPFIDTELTIRYHFVEINLIDDAQTFAVGASALR